MMLTRSAASRRGFLLFEVLLALGIFATACTAFAVALRGMGEAAALAQSEMRITTILDSALDEALSRPFLEEGVTSSILEDSEIEIDETIELMEEMENKDGQLLQEMFRIEIKAHWYQDGEWQDRSVETWRYARMYQS